MKHLKWPIIMIVACTIFNIINLSVFNDDGNSSSIYQKFGLLGLILSHIIIMIILGCILGVIINRRERFSANKVAKYGMFAFYFLTLILAPILMWVLANAGL